jgi:hypothetical protein
MNYSIILRTFCASAALLVAGCISHSETVYRDEERTKIEFESDGAARLFYETLNKRAGSMDRSMSTTEVALPLVFSHKRKVVPGKNVEFNQAVAICDSNKDGVITELEARVYANQR